MENMKSDDTSNERLLARVRELEEQLAELKNRVGSERMLHCRDCANCDSVTKKSLLGTSVTWWYCNGPLNMSQMEAPEVQPDDFCSFAIPRK